MGPVQSGRCRHNKTLTARPFSAGVHEHSQRQLELLPRPQHFLKPSAGCYTMDALYDCIVPAIFATVTPVIAADVMFSAVGMTLKCSFHAAS